MSFKKKLKNTRNQEIIIKKKNKQNKFINCERNRKLPKIKEAWIKL